MNNQRAAIYIKRLCRLKFLQSALLCRGLIDKDPPAPHFGGLDYRKDNRMKRLRDIFRRRSAGQTPSPLPADSASPLMNTSALSTGQLSFGQAMKAAYRLSDPFFNKSPEKNKARALAAGIIGLTLMQVGVAVMYNMWWGAFWDNLVRMDSAAIGMDLLKYAAIAVPGIFATAMQPYLTTVLHIKWREHMTRSMEGAWFKNNAYSRLPQSQQTDNADQRITNETDDFIWRSLTMSTAVLNALTTLTMFTGVLWNITDSPLLVSVAFGYAAAGTGIAHYLGKKLPQMYDRQAQFEADYRYALVRARENGESIAFYRGEAAEQRALGKKFNRLVVNTRDLIRTNLKVTGFYSTYNTFAAPLPILLLLPAFFAKTITIGGLHQAAQAFGHVQGSLSWFIHTYSEFARYKTLTKRLTEFNTAVDRWNADMMEKSPGLQRRAGTPGRLDIRDLLLTNPVTGAELVKPFSLTLRPGDRLVLTGVAGSGKSSLLRVLGGLWDHKSGEIAMRDDTRILCVPQKPYLPLTNLRGIICYPGDTADFTDEQVTDALAAAGLERLLPALDDDTRDGAYWARTLSGGEQQRLAFARIFLHKPDLLMLDEVTSSLDPAGEQEMYSRLIERLPGTTIISVAHREKVMTFHTIHAHIERQTLNVIRRMPANANIPPQPPPLP